MADYREPQSKYTTRWEYTYLQNYPADECLDEANELGKEGWEAIGASFNDAHTLWFKRLLD